jgi:hypothetical protein
MTELGVAGGEGGRTMVKVAGADDILARGDVDNEVTAADVAVDSAGPWSRRITGVFSGQGKEPLRVTLHALLASAVLRKDPPRAPSELVHSSGVPDSKHRRQGR